MFQQIVSGVAGLVVLSVAVLFALAFLSALARTPLLWPWPGPRQEERSERVIIINNTPPAPSQPSGPSAGSLLALAVAGLLVALTRRVDSQALPAPDDPNDPHPVRYYGER